MELIQFLVPIIAFLGFPFGLFLSFLSPEEMKPGEKYFRLIQNLLLVFILFFILDYYSSPLIVSIMITTLFFLGVFYWRNKHKSITLYIILAVLLFLSSDNSSLFALESSLIFMYGLPSGSLIKCKKKDSLKIVAKHSIFILLTIFLLLFF